MRLAMRPLRDDDDYWRARDLLRRAMLANDRRERSWHVARLDYWWWFANPDLERLPPADHVFLWETPRGDLAAVLNPEGRGQAFLQVDPAFAGPALDEAMIATAEEQLPTTDDAGRRRVRVFIDAADAARAGILARRGFRWVQQAGQREVRHRRALAAGLPERRPVPGYSVRPMGGGLETLERCYASGLAFHDDDMAVARDNRDHPEWYAHIQSAPLYRRDLDIVAVAADGSVGAFCTAWFDDVSRTAYLEPVATVPAHRRRGLARAVILEALHRLRRMGCLVAFVGGYSEPANALYASVMGPDHDVSEPWELVR
jgi:GNAT superfamily N-acetyltransferase